MHSGNNKKDGGHKGMMLMMIPCVLLLVFIFLGGDKLFSGGYLWPIFIGVFVVVHIWMMFKGHGGHGGDSGRDSQEQVRARYKSSGHPDMHRHSRGGKGKDKRLEN